MPLEENVLDPRHEAYIGWLCTAPDERQPSSKQKYADHVGVAVQTLRTWEKKESFKKEWQKRVDDIQGSPERTHTLLDALYRRGLEGDTKAAQLYLTATNRMAPPTVRVESEKKVQELSDGELDDLIGAIAAREKGTRSLRVV